MNRHFYKTIVAAACALLLIAACNDSYTPEISEFRLEQSRIPDIEANTIVAVKSDAEFRSLFDKQLPRKVDFGKEYLAVVRIDAGNGISKIESAVTPQDDGSYTLSVRYTTDLTDVMDSRCIAWRVPLSVAPSDLHLKITKTK